MTQIREGGVEIPAVTKADRAARIWCCDEALRRLLPVALKEIDYDAIDLAFARHRIAYTPTPSPEIAEQPMGECAFVDCPPGLFRWNDLVCFKSEYSSKPGQQDAYCVGSGEYFWGGTSGNLEKRRALMVTPLPADYHERLLRQSPTLKPNTDTFTTAGNDIAGLPGHGMSADVQVAEQRVAIPPCADCNGSGIIETGEMQNGVGGWGYESYDCPACTSDQEHQS